MRQQALKMGCFYWLRVKNLNHLHTELGSCRSRPMASSPLHGPNSIELHIEIIPHSFIHCLIRLLVVRKLCLVAGGFAWSELTSLGGDWEFVGGKTP